MSDDFLGSNMVANKTILEVLGLSVMSPVSIVSLLVTTLYVVVGLVFASVFKKKVSRDDFWVLVWLVYDVLIHSTLEGSFVVISLLGTVNESGHFLSLPWKEYAKADSRWGTADPTIVSLEILTVTIVEVFAIGLIYAIVRNTFYRHYLQICVCICELYGGWITFCPEWLTGSKYLNTNNFLHLWIYLIFFNMLWVVIPLLLLWQSWNAMKIMSGVEREIIIEKQETTILTNTYRTYKALPYSKKEE